MRMSDHDLGDDRVPTSGGDGVGRILAALTALCIVMLLSFAGPALADGEAVETAAESRSAAFQAVEGAVQEDIAGGPLLLATYGVIWLVLFAYVFRLVALQRRTQAELDSLRQELAESPASGE